MEPGISWWVLPLVLGAPPLLLAFLMVLGRLESWMLAEDDPAPVEDAVPALGDAAPARPAAGVAEPREAAAS